MKVLEGLNTTHKTIISFLEIIKFITIYGIVEIILFYITKGDKMMEICIHVIIFVLISIFLMVNPEYS